MGVSGPDVLSRAPADEMGSGDSGLDRDGGGEDDREDRGKSSSRSGSNRAPPGSGTGRRETDAGEEEEDGECTGAPTDRRKFNKKGFRRYLLSPQSLHSPVLLAGASPPRGVFGTVQKDLTAVNVFPP